MLFHYQVLDKNKQLLQGEVEAENSNRARLSLLHQGYEVLLLEAATEKERYLKKSFANFGYVGLKEKMLFVKHLSLMIKSGLVLDEAIDALYDQARGRMKVILYRLLTIVRKGNLLSDGLQSFPYTFSDFFVNMVRVGEQSGTLETNLINLSIKLKKDSDLKAKIRSAMLYPAIVVSALGGLGLTLSVAVLPKLLGFFKSLNVDIPFTTRAFIAFAEFIETNWGITIVVFFAFVFVVFLVNKLKQTKIVTHWLVFNLPLFHKFSKTSNLANFCRSMNLLLQGGMTIDDSLKIMINATNNVLYQNALVDVLEHVKKGDQLSKTLAQHPHYFPGIITKMLNVGELSGNLAETFEYLAQFYEDELDILSKNLSTVLEPVLLVIIGLLVGFVAMAVISPIYQLTGSIR